MKHEMCPQVENSLLSVNERIKGLAAFHFHHSLVVSARVRVRPRSLPPVELQHLLGQRGQEVLTVNRERTDVQHGEVGRELLQQGAAACVPHLR